MLKNDDQYRTWILDFFLLLARFNWKFKKMLWPLDSIAQIIYSSARSTQFLSICKNPKLPEDYRKSGSVQPSSSDWWYCTGNPWVRNSIKTCDNLQNTYKLGKKPTRPGIRKSLTFYYFGRSFSQFFFSVVKWISRQLYLLPPLTTCQEYCLGKLIFGYGAAHHISEGKGHQHLQEVLF